MLLLFMDKIKQKVEEQLERYIKELEAPALLKDAMHYSLMAGGKRIRPAFLLATIDALDKPYSSGIPAACAVEMIHTYSLIHDDLPAMDNDDYRRGKLTNHKVFGEANAILAGDALLTYAFQIIAVADIPVCPETKLTMVGELSRFAGPSGMVGGQTADIEAEEHPPTLEELYYIHQHKTADLLACSVRLGAYIAGASPSELAALSEYANHLGLAFQIQDDILDEIGNEQLMGKKVGSDKDNHKTTFTTLLGLDGATQELNKHFQLAVDALDKIEIKKDLLLEIAHYIVKRDR